MRKIIVFGTLLIIIAMIISSANVTGDDGDVSPLIWNGPLIFGDDDTYCSGGGSGEDVVVAAGAMYGDGRALVTSSFEGFGTTYSNYYDSVYDLDEYDNRELLTQGLEWLLGEPDGQKILFTGFSSYYHSNTIAHMNSLGYTVTWGGSFQSFTPSQLSGYDMVMTSCMGFTTHPWYSQSTIDATLEFVEDGGALWVLGHEGYCYMACDGATADALVNNFGIDFNMDTCYDPTDYEGSYQFPVYTNFASHDVTDGLSAVCFNLGTSMTVTPVDPVNVIENLREHIMGLDDDCFKNNGDERKNAFSNKLDAILSMIENGDIDGAISKLNNDICAKFDGSVDGNPKNDWITDPDEQAELCEKVDVLIAILGTL